MKDKILKISLMLLIIIAILGIANAVQANSISGIDMDIYVNKDGDAIVTETWNCYANKGTEVYHPYFNLGNSKITDLIVSEENETYTTLNSWNTSGNLSSKAYKCGINKVSNGVELCWGISQYGSHTYIVKYNISKFVSELNDSQMIYWTLIPYEFSNSIGKVSIKIYADEPIEDTIDVWGYGNYGGLCYVSDGAIHMYKENLNTSEYMTLLAKFPLETYNCSNKINKDFEYYYNMAEKGTTKYDKDNRRGNGITSIMFAIAFFNMLPIFLMIAFLIIIPKLIKKGNKGTEYGEFKRNLPRANEYYRDVPFDGNLFRAYYVGYTYGIIKNKTDLLGAMILKWIKEEKVKIKKITKKVFFTDKEELAIELIYKESQIDNAEERELYRMLNLASEDGTLEKHELKKWCKRNYNKILEWFSKVIKEERKILLQEGLIEETKSGKIFTTTITKVSSELTEEAKKLVGLKRFLLDYTRIVEREPIEVTILENYLIYAQMLGIAKEVTREFKDLYPEIIEQTHYMTYTDVMWINYCSTRGIYAANNARRAAERAAQMAASNYSSGGGGFSSGGGGSGSFGGGGGGGGFR